MAVRAVRVSSFTDSSGTVDHELVIDQVLIANNSNDGAGHDIPLISGINIPHTTENQFRNRSPVPKFWAGEHYFTRLPLAQADVDAKLVRYNPRVEHAP